MYTATKFSDIAKAVKSLGYKGIWECKITFSGRAIIYMWRKNIKNINRLHPISRDSECIEGFIMIDINSHFKSVSICEKNDKDAPYLNLKHLGPKSFPVQFTIAAK